jgi:hypothetical protein
MIFLIGVYIGYCYHTPYDIDKSVEYIESVMTDINNTNLSYLGYPVPGLVYQLLNINQSINTLIMLYHQNPELSRYFLKSQIKQICDNK